jgi:hypothetical protein
MRSMVLAAEAVTSETDLKGVLLTASTSKKRFQYEFTRVVIWAGKIPRIIYIYVEQVHI